MPVIAPAYGPSLHQRHLFAGDGALRAGDRLYLVVVMQVFAADLLSMFKYAFLVIAGGQQSQFVHIQAHWWMCPECGIWTYADPGPALVISKDIFIKRLRDQPPDTPCVPRTESAFSFLDPQTAPWPVRPAWRPSLVTLAKRTMFSPAGPIVAERTWSSASPSRMASSVSKVLLPSSLVASRNSTRSSSMKTFTQSSLAPWMTTPSHCGALERNGKPAP